jgi:hypothetical protein
MAIAGELSAQTGGIKGFVNEKDSRSPVIYTNVYFKGTTYGATTDANGFYSITRVPAGTYTLMVTFLGYDTLQEQITITPNNIITKNLFLNKSSIELRTVNISAEAQEAKTEVRMSVTQITPQKISQLPTLGGQPEFAQYLQVIPGVIFTGDQGGQLYIRGGTPVQNAILFDGMYIYNGFHSIGLFSVIDADMIRSADVYTGGFGAQFGNRISSVMDITSRDGNANRLGGKLSVSTFGAKLNLEGPLKKATPTNDASISYSLSYKNSYLDQTSKTLYNYADSNGLPYSFNDFYGKVSFNSGQGSKIDLSGFHFSDNANYANGTKINWRNYGGGGKFILLPRNSSAIVDGVFSYSDYLIDMQEPSLRKRESGIKGFNFGLNNTYFSGNSEIKFGMEVVGFNTNFTFTNQYNQVTAQIENNTIVAGYFKYKFQWGKLIVDPSLRAQYYANFPQGTLEPRLGLKYNLTNFLRIKAAGGIYTQNLMAGNSDRDVVNLFYGFLSSPERLQGEFTDKDGNSRTIKNGLQRSIHYIAGFEIDLIKGMNLNVEGYYKDFPQLVNINRNKIFSDTPDNSDKPDIYKKDYIIENGNAYGVDLALKYERKRLYVWAVYSWMKVVRWDGIQEYSTVFDRRHNANLLLAYTLGRDLDWEISARFNYGSGFPFTQTQGFFEQISFDGSILQDYTTANGDLGIAYGELNKGRLPDYARMDISAKKKWTLGVHSSLEASAGITNVFNRENIFYFDRVTYTRINQLPFMPNAALTLLF